MVIGADRLAGAPRDWLDDALDAPDDHVVVLTAPRPESLDLPARTTVVRLGAEEPTLVGGVSR